MKRIGRRERPDFEKKNVGLAVRSGTARTRRTRTWPSAASAATTAATPTAASSTSLKVLPPTVDGYLVEMENVEVETGQRASGNGHDFHLLHGPSSEPPMTILYLVFFFYRVCFVQLRHPARPAESDARRRRRRFGRGRRQRGRPDAARQQRPSGARPRPHHAPRRQTPTPGTRFYWVFLPSFLGYYRGARGLHGFSPALHQY